MLTISRAILEIVIDVGGFGLQQLIHLPNLMLLLMQSMIILAWILPDVPILKQYLLYVLQSVLRVQRVHLALELEQLYFEADLVHQRFVYHLTHCFLGQQLIQIVLVLHLIERSDVRVDGLLDRALLGHRAAAL